MFSLLYLLHTSLILSGSVLISAQSTTDTVTSSDDAARAAFIPWSWVIKPDGGHVTCPAASSTLGTFAAVNVCVTILSLVLGDRRMLHKLTKKNLNLGKSKSHSWRYMWLVTFSLQLAANALVALIYKIAGNDDSPSIGELVLFFTTRPRLGWLVLNLVSPFFAGKISREDYTYEYGYYEGNSLCLIFAELPLQLMSMDYYGRTAHFAATKGYYIIGHLEGADAHNAHLMYAGALLALVAAGFSIVTILWQIYRDPELNPQHDFEVEPLFTIAPNNFKIIGAFLSIGVMSFGWVGAWLFWVGYVRLAGDLYCPPKLTGLLPSGIIWTLFSTIGSVFGGAF